MALCALTAAPAAAFKATEHKEMGDLGFDLALRELQPYEAMRLFKQPHMHPRHRTIGAVAGRREFARFSMGDLVAIYGDHVTSVTRMNSAKFARYGRTLTARAEVLKRVTRGMSVSSFPHEHRRMVELAINNPTHFSGSAARTYFKWHRKAIRLARNPAHLWLAMHFEALALHSFTDLFAFGHMIDNRTKSNELITKAKEIKAKFKPAGIIAGALAKAGAAMMGARVNYLHNALNWKGARLSNLQGQTWTGYGDGRYRIPAAGCKRRDIRHCSDPITYKQRQVIVSAVAMSIGEVLRAALGRPGTQWLTAMCVLPVRYAFAHWPLPIGKQADRVAILAARMRALGRPIERNGFDFSLGVLRYERAQRRGRVDYYKFVRRHCRPS